jgi:manganese/zinc/iron transport system permease protein
LRAIYESHERAGTDPRQAGTSPQELLAARSWSWPRLRAALAAAERDELVHETADGTYRLSEDGWEAAARTVRNHRLWEAYLINHADVAASHVDRDADQIEHVLGSEMVRSLEKLIAPAVPGIVPPSPHVVRAAEAPA